jgi:hypothetical protein
VEEEQETRKKLEREQLKRFLDSRTMVDPDGKEFQKELEASKIKLGPYAMKLAQQYVRKQMKKHWGEPTEVV